MTTPRQKLRLFGGCAFSLATARMAFMAAAVLSAASLAFWPSNLEAAQKVNATAREARAAANAALADGDFERAIEFLQQLIEYLGDSDKDVTRQQMEPIFYKLGVAYFFTAQFANAEKAFRDYLKRYPRGVFRADSELYIADSFRFRQKIDKAFEAYKYTIKKYARQYSRDQKADIYCAMVRCKIAKDEWDKVPPLVKKVFITAPDADRRNWAASILTITYLKRMEVSKVFDMAPYLLRRNSFASRSVALNMELLAVGDALFGEEEYRRALWIYRLIYSHDMLQANAERFLEYLRRKTERLKKGGAGTLRTLMRIQERIGETEAELKALEEIPNYDIELCARIAKAYFETSFFREARELYLYLHNQVEDPSEQDEDMYLAFRCSVALRPLDRAFKLGERYMEEYKDKGEYFDAITMTMGKLYALLEDWPKVIAHFKKTLEIKPGHEDKAECEFLIAYASFMEEDFDQTIFWLTKMNKDSPGNPRYVDSLYWLGMAYMFTKKYKEAQNYFEELRSTDPASQYTEDATYRIAVCLFGRSKMKEAEKHFSDFVVQYPNSKLLGEANMMLGDIAANDARLKKAVKFYQKVADYPINIELYNYAMFRCGEILFQNELKYDKNKKKLVVDYDAVIEHFNKYIARNRPGSNIPQAIFFIGRSLWSKGERSGALARYLDAIEKYGNTLTALGVDMMLEEWIGKANSLKDKDQKERTWKQIRDLISKARKEHKPVLALRLQRALLYKQNVSDEQKARIIKGIVQEKNVPIATPSTLVLIMDEALKKGNVPLAEDAANTIIDEFTETDYALDARMFLAKQAIKRKEYKTALKHLGVIREVFATDLQAAEALAMMGDLYLEKKDYDKAEACYKDILAVKEWKGKLWPRALYGIAQSLIGRREYAKACVPLERIYVMYSFYKGWCAKAYLERSRCLVKLREYRKAATVLREMMKYKDDYSKFKEWSEAKAELRKLERKI